MEYEGAEYLGILRFDSYSVCQRVYGFLLQHRGESIQEIGEIDLDSVYEERSANEVKGRERLKLAHFIKTGFHNGR
jgi:hypothetical protein